MGQVTGRRPAQCRVGTVNAPPAADILLMWNLANIVAQSSRYAANFCKSKSPRFRHCGRAQQNLQVLQVGQVATAVAQESQPGR